MAVRLEVTPPSAGTAQPEPLVYGFDQPRITIGRAASADVRLPSRTVSDTHAIIRLEDGAFALVDQGSTNGTSHNGQPMVEGRRKLLRAGDRIDVAGYRIVFQETVRIDSTTTPERTAGLARRIVREALGVLPAERRSPVIHVVGGPDVGAKLTLGDPGCKLVVGRDDACDLRLSDADVSRTHVELSRDWEGVTVRDLGSKNGMSVNGRRLGERRLRDRDEIVIASTVLAFEDAADGYLREIEGGADEKIGAAQADAAGAPTEGVESVASSPAPSGAPIGEGAKPPDDASPRSADGARTGTVGPMAAAPAGGEARSAALAPPPRRAPRRGGGRSIADVIVFLLAAVVLVGSVAALVVLLRAG